MRIRVGRRVWSGRWGMAGEGRVLRHQERWVDLRVSEYPLGDPYTKVR